MTALDRLADMPRWVAWRTDDRSGKATKIPYSPHGGKAKAGDPSTWGTRAEAEDMAGRLANGKGGGIGVQLGDVGDGTFLGGIDLDSCIADDGTIAPWAAAIRNAVPTYAEKSPSGRGIKLFFHIARETGSGHPRRAHRVGIPGAQDRGNTPHPRHWPGSITKSDCGVRLTLAYYAIF
jgi:hypothetical protein